ncbi:MAG: N-acetylmuramic acid 6-phosphate etherase [Chloroflexota bacterium]|nr:N-acetylmuramic acid 6-phosphate etherase [Chloroflexota bacterium]
METSNRSVRLSTENQNPATARIDKMSTLDMLAAINEEDAGVALAVSSALPEIARAVDTVAGSLRGGGRLFYVGAGTSGRLGILDAAECVPTFGASPEQVQGLLAGGKEAVFRAVEGAEDSEEMGRHDLRQRGFCRDDVVCGIAASGTTPYVIGALTYAKSIRARSIAICCNLEAPILALADVGIAVDVGPEVIAGSTRMKAGTAQKLILNMLSTAAMISLGKVYRNLMVDLQVTNRKLAKRALRLVMQLAESDEAQAAALLSATDNDVKTAVVMARLGITLTEARERLHQADGYLYRVIDDWDL